jgi:hypothetical protein
VPPRGTALSTIANGCDLSGTTGGTTHSGCRSLIEVSYYHPVTF